jgi:hypothetical protein
MNWLWLNIPLMAVFSIVIAGIPMWMVLRRPEPSPPPLPREEADMVTSQDEAWLREQAAVRR